MSSKDFHNHYLHEIYPLQDQFLAFFNSSNGRRFYLTGGTALSRFYFQHRYSEDLDFFSRTELSDFRGAAAKILNAAQKEGFPMEVETASDHFFRIFMKGKETSLKIDFVNEPVFHFGEFRSFSLFACVDNELNILANKISCVSRCEVKDIADIWTAAKHLAFSWRDIMDIANKKSPVDPVETSKIIKTLPVQELKLVRWAFPADVDQIYRDLQTLTDDILLGQMNSLFTPLF